MCLWCVGNGEWKLSWSWSQRKVTIHDAIYAICTSIVELINLVCWEDGGWVEYLDEMEGYFKEDINKYKGKCFMMAK